MYKEQRECVCLHLNRSCHGDLCLFNSLIKSGTHETHIFNVSAYATTAVHY